MKKLFRSSRHRDGISIIEVLTSLAVATIGVFGVLVLIPFAVKQAQIGLDQDAADLIGRNALEDLQTHRFTSVTDEGQLAMRGSKVLVNTSGVTQPVAPIEVLGQNPPNTAPNFFPVLFLNGGLNTANPRIIHFDPLAVSNIGFPTTAGGNNPDFLTGQLPPPRADTVDQLWNDLRVTVATGICRTDYQQATPLGTLTFHHLLDSAEVNRIFVTEDDLIIGDRNFLLPQTADDAEAKSEVDLPQPVFDVSTDGHLMKRQTNGRISWSAIFVPVKDGNRVKALWGDSPTVTTKYKVYVLVYKDRSVDPTDAESVMNVAVVNRHTAALEFGGVPPTNTNAGYTDAMDQLHLNSPSDGVFKDDWVMVINRRPAPEYGAPPVASLGFSIVNSDSGQRLAAEEAGYDVQIGFAKVLSVISDATTSTLNVAGGPFDFYYSDIAGTNVIGTGDDNYGFDIAGDPDEDFTTETFAIHLKNVINVYERTITLERDSSWN
jgi:hypothetical protein